MQLIEAKLHVLLTDRRTAPRRVASSYSSQISVVALFDSLARQQLPQHKRQNPAVAVIIDLDRRIDPQFHRHGTFLSILVFDFERYLPSGLNRIGQSGDRKNLRTIKRERLRACSIWKLQWQYPHADEIGAMDPFKTRCHHRFYTQQTCAFRRPIAR